MNLRRSAVIKITFCVLLVIGLIDFGIIYLPANSTKSISISRTDGPLSHFSFLKKNRTKELQLKYPLASCPIGKELLQGDYPMIEECVRGYVDLEKKPIDLKQMELTRVLIHKPYLTRNDSLMIEVGGYMGVDVQRLLNHGMHPNYIVLEPVPKFYQILVKTFKHDNRFTILNYGLGRKDQTLTIPIQTDATSLFTKNKNVKGKSGTTNITIHKSTRFFDEVGVQKKNVDLLNINCEGCEFELLEDLISTDYIQYFDHIQFQFHMHLPYIKQEACRYCQIMQLLKRSHTPMFQYRHTWQAWKKILI